MTEIDVQLIGKNIQKYRRAEKLSQEQLAELAGLSSNYLARIERGEVQSFSAVNLLRIANALHTSVDDLYQGARQTRRIVPQPYRRELLALLDQMDTITSEKLSKSFISIIKIMSR